MKKIILIGIALFFFACSGDEYKYPKLAPINKEKIIYFAKRVLIYKMDNIDLDNLVFHQLRYQFPPDGENNPKTETLSVIFILKDSAEIIENTETNIAMKFKTLVINIDDENIIDKCSITYGTIEKAKSFKSDSTDISSKKKSTLL